MIFLSKWSSQTLCAGAELGVFDCLSLDATRDASDRCFSSQTLYGAKHICLDCDHSAIHHQLDTGHKAAIV
jgi:hypothetical protein